MKKYISILISVLLIVVTFAGCGKGEYTSIDTVEDTSIKVVTFNCAAPWGSLLNDTLTTHRVKRFASYMNAIKPDIIGTQEMNNAWLNTLGELLVDYQGYGKERGGDENDKKSEMNSVFWLKDKYRLIDSGTFWLSETPTLVSKYEGAGCNRICTWVALQDIETQVVFIHMNTHLDNASEEAANFGMEVIIKQLDAIKEKYGENVILTGDFNETKGMKAYESAASVLDDTSINFQDNIKGTYHDWGKEDSKDPIDFIFVKKGTTVNNYQVLDNKSAGYVSDHYGVYSEIEF